MMGRLSDLILSFLPSAGSLYIIASAMAFWPRSKDQYPRDAIRRWGRMHLYIPGLLAVGCGWAFIEVYVLGH
jgi:hypothetical protein